MTMHPDDVTPTNISHVGEMQRLRDDVMMTLTVGVTLGALLAVAIFAVTCVALLVWRRRRRHRLDGQTTAADGNSRVDPETTENRRNESSSLPRNNAATSSYSRYSKDGTLVLTVTNNCAGSGSDVTQGAGRGAAYIKNDNAAARASPGKCSISTVSDDVTRFSDKPTEDVNVWPCNDYQASALHCDVRCDKDYRRGSSENVCDNAGKYHRKYPRENVECQSPGDYRENR